MLHLKKMKKMNYLSKIIDFLTPGPPKNLLKITNFFENFHTNDTKYSVYENQELFK